MVVEQPQQRQPSFRATGPLPFGTTDSGPGGVFRVAGHRIASAAITTACGASHTLMAWTLCAPSLTPQGISSLIPTRMRAGSYPRAGSVDAYLSTQAGADDRAPIPFAMWVPGSSVLFVYRPWDEGHHAGPRNLRGARGTAGTAKQPRVPGGNRGVRVFCRLPMRHPLKGRISASVVLPVVLPVLLA
jgi:hypothetical protein